jgi:hypothetical protein
MSGNQLACTTRRTSFMPELQPLAPQPVSRNAGIAVFLMLVGTAMLFLLYWTPYGIDDPWITYRYAENLAKGLGFVYNEGERVLGTSTPLYTLILAVASLAGLSVPHVSWVICGLSTVVTLLLLFYLVRRLHSEVAAVLAVALLASAQLFVRGATWGMETPLYAALIIGAFLSYLTGRELLAAGLAGLCLLTRLDGAAVGATLFLVHVIARREFPWRSALVFIVTIAPWYLFSLGYFGSLSPNSMTAKQLHTGNHFLFWMPQWLIAEPRAWLAGIGALVLLASPAKRVGGGLLVVWAGSYSLAYTFARIHPYEWYLTPLLPVLAGLAAIGVLSSAEWVATRLGSAEVRRLAVIALVAAILAPDAYRAAIRISGDEGELGLEGIRYEAALWLRDSLPDGAPIASGGIGILGYYNDRHIFDAMGLVTPQVVRLTAPVEDPRVMPFPRFLPAVLEDYDPEYVFDGFWLSDGQDMPDVMRGQYERVRTWSGEDPRWPPFILYRRLHQNGG